MVATTTNYFTPINEGRAGLGLCGNKNITSSVYDCTVEDVEHVVIALTGAHMHPACVTELTSSEYLDIVFVITFP